MAELFPPDLAADVHLQWMTRHRKPAGPTNPTGPAPKPPSVDTLRDILNTCFFASLRQEEGRPIRFRIAWCSPDDFPRRIPRFSKYTRVFELVEFEQPREFTTRELIRMSPACNYEKTVMLVHQAHEKLLIWGIADSTRSSLLQGSIGHARLNDFRITSVVSGELQIEVGSWVGVYRDGKFNSPVVALSNSGSIYSLLRDTSLHLCATIASEFPKDLEQGVCHGERDYRSLAYLEVLQSVIDGMHQLRHGGCILICQDSNIEDTRLKIKYPCSSDAVWRCLCGYLTLRDQRLKMSFEETVEGDPWEARSGYATVSAQEEDCFNGLTDSIDSLVQLTAVDGALVITQKFEILGFGAVIPIHEDPSYKVFRCEDRNGETRVLVKVDELGTRHRSAFEFCFQKPNTIAVVASQDGGTRTIAQFDGEVCCWENLRLFGGPDCG